MTTMNKVLITAIIIFLNFHFSFGQRYAIHPSKKDSKQLITSGDSLYYANKIKESITHYEQASKSEGYSKDLLLNLAGMYSQENDILNCVKILNQVLDSGFVDLQHLTRNEELQNLRKSKEWSNIVKRCQGNFANMVLKEKVRFPFISGLIISLANDDQLALWKAELKNKHKHAYSDITLDSVDKFKQKLMDNNLQELKIIFEKYGYLWEDDLGVEATHAAWLIMQHADSDIPFQTDYLVAMKNAIDNGRLIQNKKDYAYLYDRVQKNMKKPQRYGTQVSYQITTDEKTNKQHVKINPYPMEKPETLDQRRKEMGLPSWGEYLKMIQQISGF